MFIGAKFAILTTLTVSLEPQIQNAIFNQTACQEAQTQGVMVVALPEAQIQDAMENALLEAQTQDAMVLVMLEAQIQDAMVAVPLEAQIQSALMNMVLHKLQSKGDIVNRIESQLGNALINCIFLRQNCYTVYNSGICCYTCECYTVYNMIFSVEIKLVLVKNLLIYSKFE